MKNYLFELNTSFTNAGWISLAIFCVATLAFAGTIVYVRYYYKEKKQNRQDFGVSDGRYKFLRFANSYLVWLVLFFELVVVLISLGFIIGEIIKLF